MRTAYGLEDNGIAAGNTYDKYASRNPLVRWLMAGFDAALTGLVERVAPRTIHEVGCGEGYWVLRWQRQGLAARGTDVSAAVIDVARTNAATTGDGGASFEVRSIYELSAPRDDADLIVCCEVLEHLDDPAAGLRALARTAGGHVIMSVPREPVWRMLNMARGSYLRQFGNTPGHLQHWSQRGFVRLVSEYFEVVEVRAPLPWTMVLCRPRR